MTDHAAGTFGLSSFLAMLDGIETSSILRESRHLSEVHKQLTTSDKSHHEKDLCLRLEDITHSYEERMVRLEQDVLLKPCRLNLIVLDDNILS